MSQRDPGAAACGQGRGYTGNHTKRNAGCRQCLCLVRSVGKHAGVSPLESHHDLAGPCQLDHLLVDLRLGPDATMPMATQANLLGSRRRMIENLWIDQVVVEHNIRMAKAIHSLKGNQARIPRPCPHQGDHGKIGLCLRIHQFVLVRGK